MSKTLVLLPLAFVMGGMFGYLSPSEELRQMKAKAAAEPAKKSAVPANGFGSFAQLVNIPDEADVGRRRHRPKPKAEVPTAPAASNDAPVEAAAASPAEPRKADAEAESPNPEDLRLRLEEAADLWRTRAEMAKAKAIEKLGLDKEGEARFMAAIAAMNDRLRDSMQAMADLLTEQEAMTPELGVRLMGDLSTAVAETYDALGAVASEEHRADVSNLMMTDFVDPMVAEPLIAVQGKLDGHMGMGGGRRK